MAQMFAISLQLILVGSLWWSESSAQAETMGGESCQRDSDCKSGYCYDTGNRIMHRRFWNVCAPGSNVPGKVAGGGRCRGDANCFSNFCVPRTLTCSADSPQQGKVGAAGICEDSIQCLSGICEHFFKIKLCLRDSLESSRLSPMLPCRMDDDCLSNRCREMPGRRRGVCE